MIKVIKNVHAANGHPFVNTGRIKNVNLFMYLLQTIIHTENHLHIDMINMFSLRAYSHMKLIFIHLPSSYE